MKPIRIKNAGVLFIIWLIISAILSGIATFWSIENATAKDSRIWLLYFLLLVLPVFWFLRRSLSLENNFSEPNKKEGTKCDAKRINNSLGGFTCSILGETIGANWLWEKSPYKEKIQESPECNARITKKQGIFGEKYIFSCWVMGKFRVKHKIEELESKVKNIK